MTGVLGLETSPAGVAIGITLSLATLAMTAATAQTNTPAGTGIQAEENLLTTAGNLADSTADKYARTLVTLGGQFDRVVTDWGRLKSLGGPLAAGQLPHPVLPQWSTRHRR